jgi:hypothetical protein
LTRLSSRRPFFRHAEADYQVRIWPEGKAPDAIVEPRGAGLIDIRCNRSEFVMNLDAVIPTRTTDVPFPRRRRPARPQCVDELHR